MNFFILCLTIMGAAVMASEHGNTKTLNERVSDAVISAKPLLGEARVLLANSLRALEPMKKELKEYSSRILSYSKELFASDPKTRSAAVGNARALAKAGAGLLNKAARALSPLKKDATELATRAVSIGAKAAGLSNIQERGLTDIITWPFRTIWSVIEWIFGGGDDSDESYYYYYDSSEEDDSGDNDATTAPATDATTAPASSATTATAADATTAPATDATTAAAAGGAMEFPNRRPGTHKRRHKTTTKAPTI